MATTIPTPKNNTGKSTNEAIQPGRAQAPASKATAKKPPTVAGKTVNLDVVRKDVTSVEVVDTDFVLNTQSGRKILIRDGALHAVTDEDFTVIFADEETVTGKMLFSESQNTVLDAGPLKWSSGAGESSASLVVPAAFLGSTVSYKVLGGAALVAAAAAGKKKNDPAPTPDNTQKAKDALSEIGKFADDNADSMPTQNGEYVGKVPAVTKYIDAQITGVNELNIGAINDALATKSVTSATIDTAPKLQALVDAYNRVLSLANGEANAAALRPTAEQYTLIGITGLEPLGAQASAQDIAIRAAKTMLLGDVIDRKNFVNVDTIKEIQALLSSVSAVMSAAQGGTLTKADLDILGITGVTNDNLVRVLVAINKTSDDGTEVDTVIELQNLVNTVIDGNDAFNALNIIVRYAQNNDGVPPTADTYMAAGVITPANAKVSDKEAAAFNDALRTDSVTGESVNTVVKVQGLVDAYRKVFALADGFPNNADDSKDLTQAEYQRIGADVSKLNNDTSRLRLLNDIVEGQSFDGVNTIAEINDLIRIANAIQDRATGAAGVLTVQDLQKIGIRGITADNLDLLLQAVAEAGALGSDTVPELQDLLNTSLTNGLTFAAISEDRGFSDRDFITNDSTLVFSGNSKAAEGTRLLITLKGTGANGVALRDIVLDGKVINAKGEWQASNGVPLADGDYTLVVQMYDGNQLLPNSTTFSQHVVVDTQVEGNLSNASIAITGITEDRGSNSDFITADNALIYKGTSTAPAGTQVALKIDGVVYWGAEVKSDGTWSLDNTGQTLTIGEHTVQAFLADRAGNLGVSAQIKVNIIVDGLTLESKTTGPIGMSSNLELLFSTDVRAGVGKKIIITDLTENKELPSIDVTDTSQVTIDGRKVTINPKFDLVRGHQYKATIESGAFQNFGGTDYQGLSDGWTFSAVDPSMTLGFAGTGIDLSDGINQAELASNNLVVKGEISSVNLNAVSNARITKIKFIRADGSSAFVIASANSQSDVEGLTWSADGKTWTLANNASWTSKLDANTSYTISAELAADVASNPITPQTYQSTPVLIDTSAPLLTSIVCDKTVLSKGTVAKFTFTFSEDPKASFDANSLEIAQVNGQPVGTILSITGSGNTRIVLLQANDNLTFNATATSPTLKVKTGAFTDGAGNVGTVQAGLVYPELDIDTQGPIVNSVNITGVFVKENSAEKTTGTLLADDKVRVSLTMSEQTMVMGVPTFTIVIGNATRQAKYVSGSGSNVLVFEYTVGLGDVDNDGGITAVANSLSLGSGRISDELGNLALLVDDRSGMVGSPAVGAGTNQLMVDSAGANDALLKIQKFADDNASPVAAEYVGTPPTLEDYKNANVNGVTDKNIDAINNALATDAIKGVTIDTAQKLQNLVSAYIKILTLSDGQDNVLTRDNPDFLQYGLIGVQGVDSVQASLLGDVIDFRQTTDVDTIPEIQTLANAVAAVMRQAQNISGLTRDQLSTQLSIQGVTADNFAAIQRAISNTPDNGSGVDTWQELQALVTSTAQQASAALNALQTFADVNTESWPVTSNNGVYKGTVPSWNTYATIGIGSEPGITDDNLASLINDALATAPITGVRISTMADVQNVVTAYASIVRLANSSGDTLLSDLPSADTYNLMGVTGFEATSSAASKTKAQLLSDIIDRKRFEDINTIKEIQALADAAAAVMANAAGTGSVTVEQLKLLGFDVPSTKIAAVVAAIAGTPNRDGTDVDTYIELSRLINANLEAVDQAVLQIANFADQNRASKPTPEGNFSYDTRNTPKPTAATYNTVGITGGAGGVVTDAEADAFNDALATLNVTFTSVNSKEKIQALADAYRAVLAAADGSATPALTKPTLQQYGLLGVTGLDVTQEATQAQGDAVVTARVSLLGDVIDRKNTGDVDTVLEIQALANIVTRVMNQAKDLNGLTKADLERLGIQGVTDDNLAAVLKAIGDTADDGTGVDTYVELQNLVVTPAISKFDAALGLIQRYADAKTDPTQLGTEQEQPTVQTYLDLGITSVTAGNLKSMNSALATASVKAQQVPTAQAVRDLVNAYLEILTAADGLPDGDTIQEKDYTLLGVDNVVGSAPKVKLLSDVIDRKNTTAVDTADELQALASIVTAVMNSAAETAGGLTSPDQLTALGVTGVTSGNFSKVLLAIQGTINDGTGVDTVIELQALVNGVNGKQATALQTIAAFANVNTQSRPLDAVTFNYAGVAPTRQDYVDAGITGVVTDDDARSFNDALATSLITGNSVADQNNPTDSSKLQALVNAYRKFFALADGPDNPTSAPALTSTDGALLGVNTSISGANRLNLLSDIVDRQSRTGVDTIEKINQLTVIANAIQDQAEDKTPTRTLSISDFALLGIRGISSANLNEFLKAIKDTTPDATDSVPELQNLLFNSLSVGFTAISDDTGVSSTDFVTSDNQLTFRGTSNAADGTAIRITLKRANQPDITLDGRVTNGQWQVNSAVLLDGKYAVSAQLLDGSTPLPKLYAFAQIVEVDTTNTDPDLLGQSITIDGISTDTGVLGDFKTSDTTLIFNGSTSAAPGSYVGITVDGGPMIYGTVDANRKWTVDNTSQVLDGGTHTVVVHLIDKAGNIVVTGATPTIVTIETGALILSSLTEGAIASNAPLVLTFNKSVVLGAGNIKITDETTNTTITIPVTDNAISITGSTVTIKPTGSNQLVGGRSYRATIDAGAFISAGGESFDGLLGTNDWRFQTADPSTTITLGGAGVDASNGINATELSNLTISGVASSLVWSSVSNAKVTKLTFISTDPTKTFTLDTSVNINPDRTWSLANAAIDKSKFDSGLTYTVQATITSTINGTDLTSVIHNNTPVLVDTVGPGLSITSSVSRLALGQTATYTFTFDEAPVGFTMDDIRVSTVRVNNIDTLLGTLSDFRATSDPKVFTVVFTASLANIDLPNAGLFSVAKEGYTDAAGNIGKDTAQSPTTALDTRAPTIVRISISGLDSNNADKTTALDVGDKIRVTLAMSEVTTLVANGSLTPGFTVDIGGVKKTATFVASSNNSGTLVFEYTIVSGDNDVTVAGLADGGITADMNSLVNVAALLDTFTNAGVLSTNPVGANSNTIIVDTTASALNKLALAAQSNNASSNLTSLAVYQKAGAVNVVADNLGAYNSALNSSTVIGQSVDTTQEVQSLVDAYNTILNLADGGVRTNTFATAQQYQLIGVTPFSNSGNVAVNDKVNLLNDAIDRKNKVAVDEVSEVQALADAVEAVMQTVNGATNALTRAQLELLGVQGVTDANLPSVLAAIDATPSDGTGANTVAKLQALVTQNAVNAAIVLISNFAAENSTSSNTGDPNTFTYKVTLSGRKPTLLDYTAAGVTGVTANNIDAINDALATATVDLSSTNTASGIQRVVDAYNAVFALADAVNGTNPTTNAAALKAAQLSAIGAKIGTAVDDSSNLALLNSVLDAKGRTDVDTVEEINTLSATVNAIMDIVNTRQAVPSALLSATHLTNLGLKSVTAANIAGILDSISAQTNGLKLDTLGELQGLVDFYNAAPPAVGLLTDSGINASDNTTNIANLRFGNPSVALATTFISIDGGRTYVSADDYNRNLPSTTGTYTVLVRQVSVDGYLGQPRSFTFNLDMKAPDAINVTPSGSTGNVYYGATDFGKSKLIAPNVQRANDSDIAVITLTLNGIDTNSDRFTYLSSGTSTVVVSLSANLPLSAVTMGGVSGVNLKYTYTASNSSGTFEFSADASRPTGFSSAEVQAIEKALGFSTTRQDNSTRTLTLSHTDVAGNSNASSGAATVTFNIDNQPPSKVVIGSGAAEFGFYNKTANDISAAVAIAANIQTPPDTDIAKIQLTFGSDAGVNTASDRLLFGGAGNNAVTLALGQSRSDPAGINIGGVDGVVWQYDAATKTITFSLSNGSAFKNFEVAALEASLQFQIQDKLTTTEGRRTFTFNHTDLAGWSTTDTGNGATKTIIADFRPPSSVDLDGTTTGVVDTTSLQYFNQTIAAGTQTVRIAPQMGSSTSDTDIASFTVAIGGAGLKIGEDQFVIDGMAVGLRNSTGDSSRDFQSFTNAQIANVSGVAWRYNFANQTFTFTKADFSGFSASDVQAIEKSLVFKTTSSSRSQGDRTFTFTHTDYAGNNSGVAVATITVDTLAPEPIDLDDRATAPGVQNTFTLPTINAANVTTGVAIAPNINAAATNEGVASIRVQVTGNDNQGLDQLVLNASTSAAIGGSDLATGIATIGGVVGVNWSYTAATRTFTFSKSRDTFSATEVQSIERGLSFRSTAGGQTGDRAFTFTHVDLAGNMSNSATATLFQDAKATQIFLASATTANFSTSTATPTNGTALAAPSATVVEDGSVASLQIKVRGVRTSGEQLVVNGTTAIDATSITARSGTVTVNGTNWNWTYNSAVGTFVFAVANASATAAQTQDLLRNLTYRATSSTPGDDVRQFFMTATDGVGNVSSEVVSSVSVNTVLPAKHPTNSAAVLDGNDADRYRGDVIVLTFNEPVRVTPLQNTSAWVLSSGSSWGVGATVRAVDSINVNGETYATNFLVTTGTNANIFAGQAQTATFAGSQGGQALYSTKAAIIMPTFTLTSAQLTLQAWVFATDPTGAQQANSNANFQRIFDFGTQTGIAASNFNPGTEIWLGFNGNTGGLAFEYINSPPDATGRVSMGMLTTTTFAARTWQHVAATYSGTTATLYVNGQVVRQTGVGAVTNFAQALPSSVTFNHNFIGKSNWLNDGGFYGSIFDARVYTRARTADEIRNDYNGWLDPSDPQMLFQYDLNGNTTNGGTVTNNQLVGATIANGVVSRDATTTSTGVTFATSAGTTITVSADNVVDAGSNKSSASQVFQLFRNASLVGGLGIDTLVGTSGNDFIAGQGGNDTLTGGTGGDTFAWVLGETGSDRVTDFKVAEGDMVDLSGLLSLIRVGANNEPLGPNNVAEWGKYLQLTRSGDDMLLSIDLTGGGFATTTKTITFTNGALNGLNDTLLNLVTHKTIHLTAQTSTPLMLDLNGDGVQTSSITQDVMFDVQGGGQKMYTGWSDGKDGFLVLDLNNDGSITSGLELFGSATQLPSGSAAKDGFEALRQYDLNQDKLIDANDAVFAKLKVWVDTNLDGVSQSNELHGLTDIGVRAFKLNAEVGHTLDNGNALSLVSTWVDIQGRDHAFVDVTFATSWQSQASHAVM